MSKLLRTNHPKLIFIKLYYQYNTYIPYISQKAILFLILGLKTLFPFFLILGILLPRTRLFLSLTQLLPPLGILAEKHLGIKNLRSRPIYQVFLLLWRLRRILTKKKSFTSILNIYLTFVDSVSKRDVNRLLSMTKFIIPTWATSKLFLRTIYQSDKVDDYFSFPFDQYSWNANLPQGCRANCVSIQIQSLSIPWLC